MDPLVDVHVDMLKYSTGIPRFLWVTCSMLVAASSRPHLGRRRRSRSRGVRFLTGGKTMFVRRRPVSTFRITDFHCNLLPPWGFRYHKVSLSTGSAVDSPRLLPKLQHERFEDERYLPCSQPKFAGKIWKLCRQSI